MTAAELQAYVDAGLVPSTSGTSEISTPITLDGSQRVLFEPNSFVWTGSGSRSLFEYDAAGATSMPIVFYGVKVVSEVDGSSIFSLVDNSAQPNNMIWDTCEFQATGAYCLDYNNVGYIVVPVFRNLVTSGSGALRMRASGGSDFWHSTSQMVVDGWTHTGSNRVGPAFNFRGTSGLKMINVTDKGAMDLNATMAAAGWEGPLTLFIQHPRTPGEITNLQVEWTDVNDDDAPNCYIGEIRTDSSTGPGQHEYIEIINGTLTHAAIDAAVEPWRIMGGDSTNHGLVVNFSRCESPATSNFLVGGKASLWIDRPWYKPGEESTADALETYVTGIFPDCFKDKIETSTTKLPTSDSSTATTYIGSQNETDYTAEPAQYETILEG